MFRARLDPCGSTILFVDDDPGSREIAQHMLARLGLNVRLAASGGEAAALARSALFDLIVIDLRLPDLSGLQVIRDLRRDAIATPFVLLSGYLTTAVTVEAMKLGAANVLEKPVSVEDLQLSVVSALDGSPRVGRAMPARPAPGVSCARSTSTGPGSAAERWAQHVAKACTSDGDLATLERWARFIGVSCSSLCENCRVVGIQPRNARDFTRMLRAVMQAVVHGCRPDVLLDVSDRRTLRHLFGRAGLPLSAPLSVDQFLDRQRLIPREHEAVRTLRSLLSGLATPDGEQARHGPA